MNRPINNSNSAATHRSAMSKSNHPVTALTHRDVLNGRGQGVQRHPGNVTYRMLVSELRPLYAKCPDSDKRKISKSIVAAIRACGGGFLKQDERTEIFHDIGDSGDKGAWDKTSQALREGLPEIRKQIYQEEAAKGKTPFTSPDYFHFSLNLLQSLHHDHDDNHLSKSECLRASYQREAQLVAMARDQFPSSRWEDEADASPLAESNSSDSEKSANRRTSVSRLTHMSIGSMPTIESVRELLEPPRADVTKPENPLNKEVFLENLADVKEDRVSSMRHTEMSRQKSGDETAATPYSKESVMDMSIMTFAIDDISASI
ncbi:hypothetical protein ACHAXT_001729 [Thalassiosira profunda]